MNYLQRPNEYALYTSWIIHTTITIKHLCYNLYFFTLFYSERFPRAIRLFLPKTQCGKLYEPSLIIFSHLLVCIFTTHTVKPVLGGHSKIDKTKRQMVAVNEGQKYCRMLQESILQYF